MASKGILNKRYKIWSINPTCNYCGFCIESIDDVILTGSCSDNIRIVHKSCNKLGSPKFRGFSENKNNKMAKIRKRFMNSYPVCMLCNERIENNYEATIDHIVPLSKGGTNAIKNLQLAHYKCNERKSDKYEKNTS